MAVMVNVLLLIYLLLLQPSRILGACRSRPEVSFTKFEPICNSLCFNLCTAMFPDVADPSLKGVKIACYWDDGHEYSTDPEPILNDYDQYRPQMSALDRKWAEKSLEEWNAQKIEQETDRRQITSEQQEIEQKLNDLHLPKKERITANLKKFLLWASKHTILAQEAHRETNPFTRVWAGTYKPILDKIRNHMLDEENRPMTDEDIFNDIGARHLLLCHGISPDAVEFLREVIMARDHLLSDMSNGKNALHAFLGHLVALTPQKSMRNVAERVATKMTGQKFHKGAEAELATKKQLQGLQVAGKHPPVNAAQAKRGYYNALDRQIATYRSDKIFTNRLLRLDRQNMLKALNNYN